VCWFFYEVNKPGLTLDHLIHHDEGYKAAYELYKEKKTGILSTFPFGIFAYTRLDKQLRGDPLWEKAPKEVGRDPMGLTPAQANVEFFNTELYGGPKQWVDFPTDHRYVVGMCTVLFSARSRGSVTLRSANPLDNPIVDHQYLSDPLDLLVLSQGCQTINEIMTTGSATKDIIKGSWPPRRSHHKYKSREEWMPYVKETITTCMRPPYSFQEAKVTEFCIKSEVLTLNPHRLSPWRHM
jgi:choline dehydrogenase-like flavoprotein